MYNKLHNPTNFCLRTTTMPKDQLFGRNGNGNIHPKTGH